MDHDQVVKCLLAERSKVLGFIRTILGGWEDAEDIFQDASLLAIAKSQEIVDEGHLLAWLRISCRNLARNIKRSHSRCALSLSDEVLDLLEIHWARRDNQPSNAALALSECLEKLPSKSLEMVQLRYLEGLKVEEVAKRLKKPAASLYVTFSRISAALAECVERHLRAAGGDHG